MPRAPHKRRCEVAAELSAQEDPKFKGHRTSRCLLTVPRDLDGEHANPRRLRNAAISKQIVVDLLRKAYKELGLSGDEDSDTLFAHMAAHPTLVQRHTVERCTSAACVDLLTAEPSARAIAAVRFSRRP